MVKTCFNCKYRYTDDQKVASRCFKCWNHPDRPGWECQTSCSQKPQLKEQTKEGRFHGEQDP